MNPPERRKWILIVDDDSSVRLMLARVLTEEGYGVLTAASGDNALDLAKIVQVDLVLLDLNMPGTNGWQTLDELAGLGMTKSVIIITASPNQGATALKAGVGIVLEKPLHFPHLIETVRQFLAAAETTGQREEK